MSQIWPRSSRRTTFIRSTWRPPMHVLKAITCLSPRSQKSSTRHCSGSDSCTIASNSADAISFPRKLKRAAGEWNTTSCARRAAKATGSAFAIAATPGCTAAAAPSVAGRRAGCGTVSISHLLFWTSDPADRAPRFERAASRTSGPLPIPAACANTGHPTPRSSGAAAPGACLQVRQARHRAVACAPRRRQEAELAGHLGPVEVAAHARQKIAAERELIDAEDVDALAACLHSRVTPGPAHRAGQSIADEQDRLVRRDVRRTTPREAEVGERARRRLDERTDFLAAVRRLRQRRVVPDDVLGA